MELIERAAGELKKLPTYQAECMDCETRFYIDNHYEIKCNGHIITLCPWCRIDSRPWRYGRGI